MRLPANDVTIETLLRLDAARVSAAFSTMIEQLKLDLAHPDILVRERARDWLVRLVQPPRGASPTATSSVTIDALQQRFTRTQID